MPVTIKRTLTTKFATKFMRMVKSFIFTDVDRCQRMAIHRHLRSLIFEHGNTSIKIHYGSKPFQQSRIGSVGEGGFNDWYLNHLEVKDSFRLVYIENRLYYLSDIDSDEDEILMKVALHLS